MDSSSKLTTNIPLYLDSSTKISGHITLYTDSSTPIHSSFTMYTTGTIGLEQSYCTLYTDSSTRINNSGTLYTLGGTGEGAGHMTLYMDTASRASGQITLFTESLSSGSTKMPLYMYNIPPATSTNNFTLFTQASHVGTSGLYSTTSLYMYGLGQYASMPLYMSTIKDNPEGSMPLYLMAPINTGYTYNGFSLYLQNSVSGTSAAGLLPLVKMYTIGAGQLAGASVLEGNMPLYLYRRSGVYDGMSLYMLAGSANSGIPLYSHSSNFANSGVLLYIQGTGINNHFTLYAKGPSLANSGLPFYIDGLPNITDNVNLYVGGF